MRDRFYGEIRLALYLIFALVSVKALARLSLQKLPRLMKLFMGVIVLLTLELLVFQLLNWRSSIFELTELLIPFGIMISAYSLDFEKKEIDSLTLVYAVLAVLMGVSLVLFYGGGFVLREQYIAGTSKNQTGPIIGVAFLIVLDRMLAINIRRNYDSLLLVWFGLLLSGAIASLIVLRNRAGLVSVFIVSALMLLIRFRKRPTLIAILISTVMAFFLFLLVILGAINPLADLVVKAFTLNRSLGDLDSLSSGRMSVYIEGINYLTHNPVFGELAASEPFYDIPHNYVLNKMVEFGLVGSIPFLVLYAYLVMSVIRQLLSRRARRESYIIAFQLLLFSLIVSLFEYTPPYGPGVSQVMVWFMLGRFIRNKKGAGR